MRDLWLSTQKPIGVRSHLSYVEEWEIWKKTTLRVTWEWPSCHEYLTYIVLVMITKKVHGNIKKRRFEFSIDIWLFTSTSSISCGVDTTITTTSHCIYWCVEDYPAPRDGQNSFADLSRGNFQLWSPTISKLKKKKRKKIPPLITS